MIFPESDGVENREIIFIIGPKERVVVVIGPMNWADFRLWSISASQPNLPCPGENSFRCISLNHAVMSASMAPWDA